MGYSGKMSCAAFSQIGLLRKLLITPHFYGLLRLQSRQSHLIELLWDVRLGTPTCICCQFSFNPRKASKKRRNNVEAASKNAVKASNKYQNASENMFEQTGLGRSLTRNFRGFYLPYGAVKGLIRSFRTLHGPWRHEACHGFVEGLMGLMGVLRPYKERA